MMSFIRKICLTTCLWTVGALFLASVATVCTLETLDRMYPRPSVRGPSSVVLRGDARTPEQKAKQEQEQQEFVQRIREDVVPATPGTTSSREYYGK